MGAVGKDNHCTGYFEYPFQNQEVNSHAGNLNDCGGITIGERFQKRMKEAGLVRHIDCA
jgi:hypothetical protein